MSEHHGQNPRSQISSEDLAALIVDALVDAGLVARADFERAVKIASVEIEARRAMEET